MCSCPPQLSSARLSSSRLSSARLSSARPCCCSVSLLCCRGPGAPGGAFNTQPGCIMRAGHGAALFTLESILFIERSCSSPPARHIIDCRALPAAPDALERTTLSCGGKQTRAGSAVSAGIKHTADNIFQRTFYLHVNLFSTTWASPRSLLMR